MLTREMFRQQVAGLLHTVDDAGHEFRFLKVASHGVRQLPPEFIPALRMNAFITNNGKITRARSYKNQHAVPLGRFIHAQTQEFRLRRGYGVVNVFIADAHPDFSGGLVFGITNRLDNFVVVQMFGEGSRMHKLPSPSRAAAAKAAAASGKSTASREAATTGKTTATPTAA
jgi:hypothetical protein